MSRERGLALVSVLWAVAILSLIAAAMLSASLTTSQIGHNAWNAARAASAADASVNQAILSLLDPRPGRQPRADAAPSALRFDGVTVRLWLQDESGKVNLNFAGKDLLQGLFVSQGVSDGAAGALADRIVARRGPPDSLTPRIAFGGVEEVLGVEGMTPALFARLAPLLTVYGRGGAVNTQTAPRAVLRALPGLNDAAIDQILERRGTVAGTGGALGNPGSAFAITAEASSGAARVVRVAVVQFTGDPQKPYLILAWR